MRRARSTRPHSPRPALDLFEPLEPRALLAAAAAHSSHAALGNSTQSSSSFNPSGPVVLASFPALTDDMALADFTGDGNTDAAISAGRFISLMNGTGTGSFLPLHPVATLNILAGLLAAGDFNGDGAIDLLAVNRGTFASDLTTGGSWLRILINNGRGVFTPTFFGLAHLRITSVRLANLDADPEPEILLQGYRDTSFPRQEAVQIFNLAGHSLQLAAEVAAADFISAPAAADLDNDTLPDLAIGVRQADITTLRLYHNDGSLTFSESSRSTLSTSAFPIDAAIGQLYGTVRPQIVLLTSTPLVNSGPNGTYLQHVDVASLPDTTHALSIRQILPVWDHALTQDPQVSHLAPIQRILGLADANSDGALDILLSTRDAAANLRGNSVEERTLTMLLNDQAADFFPATRSVLMQRTGYFPFFSGTPDFALADLRHTGRLDLLYSEPRDGTTGPQQLRVAFNTLAWKKARISSAWLTPSDPADSILSAPVNSLWTFHATLLEPELMRAEFVDTIRIRADSNHNGILDSADTVLGRCTAPPAGRSDWTFQFRIPSSLAHSRTRIFALPFTNSSTLNIIGWTDLIIA